MDGKRLLALGFVVAFVVACGGASPSTSGAGASSAAATTGANATTAPTASVGGATATSAAAGPKLADILVASKLATYKITYNISVSGTGAISQLSRTRTGAVTRITKNASHA